METRSGSYIALFQLIEDYENPSSYGSKLAPSEQLRKRIKKLNVSISNTSSKVFKDQSLPFISEFISSAQNWNDLYQAYILLDTHPDFQFLKAQRFTVQPEFTDTWKTVVRFFVNKMDELFLSMFQGVLDPDFRKFPSLQNVLANDTNLKEERTLKFQSRLLFAWQENEWFPEMWKIICKKLTGTRLHPGLLFQNLHHLPSHDTPLAILYYIKVIRLYQLLNGTDKDKLKFIAESAYLPIIILIHAAKESDYDSIRKILKQYEFHFLKANDAYNEIKKEIKAPFKNLNAHFENQEKFFKSTPETKSELPLNPHGIAITVKSI